jgi:hypothetical protein
MGITITAVQLIGGISNQHVAALRWVCDDTGASGASSTEAVIDWLAGEGRIAWVGRERLATLQVVETDGSRHLCANRLGTLSRDLVELPRLPLYSDLRPVETGELDLHDLAGAGIGDDDMRERRIDPDAASLP